MKTQAREALDEIETAEREESAVLSLSLSVLVELADWKRAVKIAAILSEREPNVPAHWIQWAYATRRHKGLDEARAILMRGLGLHPLQAVFHFNLACYEAQLGHLDDAKVFLETACGLDAEFVELAKTDDDLAPLR
ncbi:MAG: hypothetical protein ABW223_08700 [Rariglobus sp.]